MSRRAFLDGMRGNYGPEDSELRGTSAERTAPAPSSSSAAATTTAAVDSSLTPLRKYPTLNLSDSPETRTTPDTKTLRPPSFTISEAGTHNRTPQQSEASYGGSSKHTSVMDSQCAAGGPDEDGGEAAQWGNTTSSNGGIIHSSSDGVLRDVIAVLPNSNNGSSLTPTMVGDRSGSTAAGYADDSPPSQNTAPRQYSGQQPQPRITAEELLRLSRQETRPISPRNSSLPQSSAEVALLDHTYRPAASSGGGSPSLVNLQADLAREKRANVDAEFTISHLRRENESMKAENAMLKAAAGRMGAISSAGDSNGSSRYVDQLEARIAQLTRSLELMKTENEAKDERIRLLEHKLVDQLLAGSVNIMASSSTTSNSNSKNINESPLLQQQRSSGRFDPPSARANAPSSINTKSGASHNNMNAASTSALQPYVPGDAPASPKKSAQRSAKPSMIRPASPTVASGRSNYDMDSRRYSSASRVSTMMTTQPASGPVRPPSARRNSASLNLRSVQPAPSRKASSASVSNGFQRSTPSKPSSRRGSMGSMSSIGTAASKSGAPRRSATAVKAPPSSSDVGGHPFRMSSSVQRSSSPANSLLHQPAPIRSMMVHKGASPARSATPSMRSATSTRSRPKISYNAKNDLTTMQGTTTTVTFRVKPLNTDPLVPVVPQADHASPKKDDKPFVSEKFSTTTYRPNRLVRSVSISNDSKDPSSCEQPEDVRPSDELATADDHVRIS